MSRSFFVTIAILFWISMQMGPFFFAFHDEPIGGFPAGTERVVGFPLGFFYVSSHVCCEGFMTDERTSFDLMGFVVDILFFVAFFVIIRSLRSQYMCYPWSKNQKS